MIWMNMYIILLDNNYDWIVNIVESILFLTNI